jgi:hypothetical protein
MARVGECLAANRSSHDTLRPFTAAVTLLERSPVLAVRLSSGSTTARPPARRIGRSVRRTSVAAILADVIGILVARSRNLAGVMS